MRDGEKARAGCGSTWPWVRMIVGDGFAVRPHHRAARDLPAHAAPPMGRIASHRPVPRAGSAFVEEHYLPYIRPAGMADRMPVLSKGPR